jgi:hypothetical protein
VIIECYCQGRIVAETDVTSLPFIERLRAQYQYQLRRMKVLLYFNQSFKVNAEKTRLLMKVQPLIDSLSVNCIIQAQIINVKNEVSGRTAPETGVQQFAHPSSAWVVTCCLCGDVFALVRSQLQGLPCRTDQYIRAPLGQDHIDKLFVSWLESCARKDTGGQCSDIVHRSSAATGEAAAGSAFGDDENVEQTFHWSSCKFGDLTFRVGDTVSFHHPKNRRKAANSGNHPSEFGCITGFETQGTEAELQTLETNNGQAARNSEKKAHSARTILVHLQLLPRELFPSIMPLTINSIYLDKIRQLL